MSVRENRGEIEKFSLEPARRHCRGHTLYNIMVMMIVCIKLPLLEEDLNISDRGLFNHRSHLPCLNLKRSKLFSNLSIHDALAFADQI